MTGGSRLPGLAPGLIGLLLAACDGAPATKAAAAPAPAAKAGYERELANLGKGIDEGLALAARRPDDGLIPLEVVALYQERARLTGDYADYRRAEALLEAQAGARRLTAAHCLASAKLHYTLHRLRQALAALDTCPAGAPASDVAALRADIALYSGRYREAEQTYRALVNQLGAPQHFTRLAQLRNVTGSPGEAAALLEAAERRYHGASATMKAWLKLQRGLVALDQGRFEEALALYRAAEAALPGWWLIEEHIAEVTQLGGDAARAKTLYEAIVQRTRAPEFMDALAAIEHAQGGEQRARELTGQARALYEKRIAEFPEAAAGHALDHFLASPADAARALALAEANFRTRSYGEAAIGLAKAYLQNGKPDRAAALLQAQVSAGWDTAEVHWVLSQALERTGRKDVAARERAEALRRNPQSERMYALPT